MGTEDWDDQVARLKLMASGKGDWDLSPNDRAAIQSVLDHWDTAVDIHGKAFRRWEKERDDAHARGRAEGIEAAAKWLEAQGREAIDGIRPRHAERMRRALLPTPSPPVGADDVGTQEKVAGVLRAAGLMDPATPHWEIKGKDVTLVQPTPVGPPETCSMCGDPVRYVAKHLNPAQPNLYCYRESDGYAFVHCKNAQAVRRGDYPPPATPPREGGTKCWAFSDGEHRYDPSAGVVCCPCGARP